MDRSVLQLFRSALRIAPPLARGHKTTARTKRALKIAPHDSFLPARSPAPISPSSSPSPSSSSVSPPSTSIIYNPPASEASPAHTPFLFLPESDPRRDAIHRMRSDFTHHRFASTEDRSIEGNRIEGNTVRGEGEGEGEGDLPPAMRYKRRQPKYHLGREHIDEMRRLRAEDPLRWSVGHLAAKFECSPIFVQMAAPAPAEHLAWLRAKMARKMERWGPIRRQAWEDRKRRAEMLYRGEL